MARKGEGEPGGGDPRFVSRERMGKKAETSLEKERAPETEPVRKHFENCTKPSEALESLYKSVKRAAKIGVVLGSSLSVGSTIGIGSGVAIGIAYREGFAEAKTDHIEEFEAQSVEERETAIDHAHQEAAKNLRDNEVLKLHYSPEQIDAVGRALEGFSSKEFFTSVAHESGMTEEQVVRLSRSNDVMVYSDFTIEEYLRADLGEEGMKRYTEMSASAREEYLKYRVARADSSHVAGLNGGGNVFLNITALVDEAHGDLGLLQSLTTDVLFHEHTHSFSNELLPNRDKFDASNMLYEGTTELLSNIARVRVDGEGDIYPGYVGGPTAAAAVLYEGLPEGEKHRVWHAYLTGSEKEMGATYDNVYGAGSYGKVLGGRELNIGPTAGDFAKSEGLGDWPINDLKEDYLGFVLLENALTATMDTVNDVAIADRANAWLGSGIIVPIRAKTFHGVDLVFPDGHQEGFIRLEGDQGARILFLMQGGKGQGDYYTPMAGTNAGILFSDLNAYNTLRKPVYDLSFEDRGAAAVKMIRAHKEDIDSLKNL